MNTASPGLIVSLTSYGSRIQTVWNVIMQMLSQTKTPDLVVLYVSQKEFPTLGQLPESLRIINSPRFQVRQVEDLGPHTKYFYAMQEFANDCVVTVDDDVVYPTDLLERLWTTHHTYPDTIVCALAVTLCFAKDGNYAPFLVWYKAPRLFNYASSFLSPCGVGGVLYPPHCFDKRLFDLRVIKEVCPKVDDHWITWNILEQNKHVLQLPELWLGETLAGTQETGLFNTNNRRVSDKKGDKRTHYDLQWEAILNAKKPLSAQLTNQWFAQWQNSVFPQLLDYFDPPHKMRTWFIKRWNHILSRLLIGAR